MRNKILCLLSLMMYVAQSFAAPSVKDDPDHTPGYYEVTVRSYFKKEDWAAGKRLLDEGLFLYPYVAALNELAGQYYYKAKDYDKARFHLVRALQDDDFNVDAKQLLVNVEDVTKNYSSAICYVNELLEVNPYSKTLWSRKISLYRKQNNHEEADRLLKRLLQIYPNDTLIRKDYIRRMEDYYWLQRRYIDKAKAIRTLRELIKANPRDEVYYLDLCNLLLQQGKPNEALEVATHGLLALPSSVALTRKKVGILTEQMRYAEAAAFLKEQRKRNNSSTLAELERGLLYEEALTEAQRDPYVLYGKVWETTHSEEALQYLLNTALLRGYDEDALYYLSEARKRRGDTRELLFKEYRVHKRMGNMQAAQSLLHKLYENNPTDYDIAYELTQMRMLQASELMADGFHSEALPHLQFAALHAPDTELKQSAWSKLFSCYYALGRYSDAAGALDSTYAITNDFKTYLGKKSMVLDKQGHTTEALRLLREAMQDTAQADNYHDYVVAYEEIAIPYIKSQIELGATYRAFDESVALLQISPMSEEGLRYAITTSALLHRNKDYDRYVLAARQSYPDDIGFFVKESIIFTREKQYRQSLDFLRPKLDDWPHNVVLVGAYSENSELLALQLIREHQPDSALAVIDSALVFDAKNKQLLYTKGLAFEKLHDWDSAYVYQKHYSPSPVEAAAYRRHIEALLSKQYRNEVGVEYQQARTGGEDVLTSVGTLYYTRKTRRNTYTGRVNYTARETYEDESYLEATSGGSGIMLQAEWDHEFSPKWNTHAALGWSNRYFPKISADVRLARNLKYDWTVDVHATYRRLHTNIKTFAWMEEPRLPEEEPSGAWVLSGYKRKSVNMFSAGMGASKSWEPCYVSAKADLFFMSGGVYTNFAASAKYYPIPGGRTSLTLSGAVGTAPELLYIDIAMPHTFDKLNTQVGLGGAYMVNKNLSLGLMGTWAAYYSQSLQRITLPRTDTSLPADFVDERKTKYRTLYNIHGQIIITF